MAKSIHSLAREFAAYAVEHLLRELRDNPEARLAATKRLGLSKTDSTETIVRRFLAHATAYLDGDGEIRIALPERRRRDR